MSKQAISSVVVGSLAEQARSNRTSLAIEFLNVQTVALVDVSGSMDTSDTRDGRTRYAVACEELATVQGKQPSRVAVYAFSDECVFAPGGTPTYYGGSTALARALAHVRTVAEAAGHLIVISDGMPDSETDALSEAEKFTCRIDTVYTGPVDDDGKARAFLARLARVGKGVAASAMHADDLAQTMLLLTSGG